MTTLKCTQLRAPLSSTFVNVRLSWSICVVPHWRLCVKNSSFPQDFHVWVSKTWLRNLYEVSIWYFYQSEKWPRPRHLTGTLGDCDTHLAHGWQNILKVLWKKAKKWWKLRFFTSAKYIKLVSNYTYLTFFMKSNYQKQSRRDLQQNNKNSLLKIALEIS